MRSLRNPNRKPAHPGAVLREDVLPELAWTQGELAARLMVSRQTVSLKKFCSGRSSGVQILDAYRSPSRQCMPSHWHLSLDNVN